MSRRKAREIALRVLYQREVGKTDPTVALRQAIGNRNLTDDAREFTRALIFGTIDNIVKIDRIITDYAQEWTLDRMPVVDRNVLRSALYELKYHGTPEPVCINEWVELASRFSSPEAARFIHGILGRATDEGDDDE